MKWLLRSAALGVAVWLASGLDGSPDGGLRLGESALAIVGAPRTPVSYAGVARRSVRRHTAVAVAATTTAVVVANSTAPPPPPQSTTSAFPVGTIVTALPAGCTTVVIGGVSYFDCGGTFYRAAFQSNNLVYVVSQP